jgi:NAD(P)-dependent dehydrogenase (short-subunit alcohol dehydrogenase family)
MVNNAGICVEAQRPSARIHETSEADWDLTMAVNAKSVFLGCKYAIAQMMKQDVHPFGDRGWVINMSSVFGLVGGRYNCKLRRSSQSAGAEANCLTGSYVASKAAIANLTRQVALDYAESRIHCNAINPGCKGAIALVVLERR